MSRYTGPRVKKMRALGVNLPGLSRKTLDRRPYPPGQHGQNRRRKKSDYGRQLTEKQKLRLNYGLGERQFRRLVADARSAKLATGRKLLELLERRLDNVVFRAGFAPTIPAARQLINHGHILVNGRRVDIASYRVRIGDVIAPREKSRSLQVITSSLEELSLLRPDWLEYNAGNQTAIVRSLPEAESVPFEIEVQLVVEYYSKRM
ncbi:MAG: 30S ribosomal protein S4 [Deltaproteobacteria bacterium]|nr:MAG: 30S ribosomal protein S4 [Deltaproteobacteria bacterium]